MIVHCTYLGVSGYKSKTMLYSFVKGSFFTFTYSVDPDEKQYYAAFCLGLYCLPVYSFRVVQSTKG